MIVLGIVSGVPLFAAESPIAITPTRGVLLPGTWKVLERATDVTPPSQTLVSPREPGAVKVLLSASAVDESRKIFLCAFRTDVVSMSPPIWTGKQAEDFELSSFLNGIVGQGYIPTKTAVLRPGEQNQNTPITIQVSGKNAAGEARIFTNTVISDGRSIVRLHSSRLEADMVGDTEIRAILRSLYTVEGKKYDSLPEPALTTNQTIATTLGGSATSLPPTDFDTAAFANLVQKHQSALLIVEGQKSVGSGFVCSIDGRAFAFTNTHVIAGNRTFKLTTIKNTAVTASACSLAAGRDLARFEIPAPEINFEALTDFENTVKIGDAVAVPGNSDGARVVTIVYGKVVGIGPDRIEIDAPFVQGNSGSPIIHLNSGKVIGIATYLIVQHKSASDRSDSDTTPTPRRFGYRLDLINTWEPVQWQRFFSQAATMENIDLVSADFVKLCDQSGSNDMLNSAHYSSATVRRAVETFAAAVRGNRNMSQADRKNHARRFIADLRSASRNDIQAFTSQNVHDYFRRRAEEQNQFRNEWYDALTRIMQAQMN